jgi:Tol biopolymer transport system component
MHSDGSYITRLTTTNYHDERPSWSPDGSKIAFESSREDVPGNAEIYVMNADGTNQTRLTNSSDVARLRFEFGGGQSVFVDRNSNTSPHWSPDGTKIAFVMYRGVQEDCDRECLLTTQTLWEIYVMDADGSNETRLTDSSSVSDTGDRRNSNPRWSPDGSKIIFDSNRDHGGDVYVMDADGSNQTRLVEWDKSDYVGDWGPAVP